MRPFCRKNHVHKIPRFRGGYFGFWGGEGKCRFLFLWARGFFWKIASENQTKTLRIAILLVLQCIRGGGFENNLNNIKPSKVEENNP